MGVCLLHGSHHRGCVVCAWVLTSRSTGNVNLRIHGLAKRVAAIHICVTCYRGPTFVSTRTADVQSTNDWAESFSPNMPAASVLVGHGGGKVRLLTLHPIPCASSLGR